MTPGEPITYRRARIIKREATAERRAERRESILNAYAEGRGWKEIAASLCVSSGTILLELKRAEEAGDPRVKRRKQVFHGKQSEASP